MSRFAIRAPRFFDGERMLEYPSVVLVDEGRITGVERGTTVPDGWAARQHDGVLLPGLIDAHVHLCADGGPAPFDRLADLTVEQTHATIENSLRTHLAAGVTTVRDLGDYRNAMLTWRSRAVPGLPTVVASGTPITSVGGHCAVLGGEVRDEPHLREAIRRQAELGADVVKIMASGGVLTPGTDTMSPQFTAEELRAAVDEAHRAGLPITAHAHALSAVRLALEAGADGIEHCTCLTPEGVRIDDDLLAALAESGTAVCPTLGADPNVVVPPQVVEMAARAGLTPGTLQKVVTGLHEGGVRLVAGSDGGIAPVKPHGLLPVTLQEYRQAGVPETAALTAATSAAADACGLGDRKGRIRPGYDADLVIMKSDALEPVAIYLAGHPVAASR
ncbi:amidohydrolase family protein [Spirillospora sp. CA-294931]|uniref:amidohydrolase family protein n=1 Tax=Spirillospora sp. CA-294931 TaxID=3240042 RepID=UPI003D9001C8